MKNLGFIGLGIIAASLCGADESEGSFLKKERFNVSVYNGYITGSSEEIIYRPTHAIGYEEFDAGTSNELTLISDIDDHLSHLDWKLRNLLVNGVKASASAGKLRFMVNGWYRLNSSQTTMIDRDWVEPNELTHISWSPTRLKNACEFCGEVGYDLCQWMFDQHGIVLQALAGYKHLNLNWEASGGTYHYYDEWGSFPDRLAIRYGQTFTVPYLGLQVDCNWNEMTYGLFWKVSPGISSITAHDYHALRFIDFHDQFKNGDYWMVGGNFGWNFRSLALNLSYAFDQLVTTRGNSFRNNHELGNLTYFTGGAGVCHAHQICTVDATFPF